ncbi:Peptidase_M43 domain-containing protein [Tenacibaculum sp. 190524A05c]|uniref:Peptidase_M43 domain-containing protein n=1 Tax=Tenacibaculum platacis TaxID=3137852 RepID=A0ABM9P4I8_9FLAO
MRYFLCLIFCLSLCKINGQVNTGITDDGRIIKIPVVIHLVKKGKKHNVPQIITKEIIEKELKDLNTNFSAQNDMSTLNDYFVSRDLIGKPNFQFYLKEVIKHKRHKRRAKRIKRVDPDKNLNIIVGKYGNASPCTLAEGYEPEFIQIDYTNFGDGSQTVTHEVGHWLGLFHVWGIKGSCKKRRTLQSDYVDDTPLQIGCTDVKRVNECPPIDASSKPNYNNFMDYSSCRCFFTKGQVKTIREKVIKFRNIIFTNSID